VTGHLAGVWLLEHTKGGDAVRPNGVLLLTAEGWCAMQVGDGIACAGRYGIDGSRFLLDPVVALAGRDVGRVQPWDWSFDGDVLVLASPDTTLRWHREGVDVVTGLGSE